MSDSSRPSARGAGVALVGYRGSGKTTVGMLLAERLGWSFADGDAVLEKRLGRSIPDLFAREGEPYFRDQEEQVLKDLCGQPGLVLATGGGAVLRPANRAALQRHGLVVWLRSNPEEVARRIAAQGVASRPALTALGTLDEIAAVLAEREPLYEAVADRAIDTAGLSAQEIAVTIAAELDRWTAADGGGRR